MNASYFKSLAVAALAWCLCESAAPAALTDDWKFLNGNNPTPPDAGDPNASATITVGQASTGWHNDGLAFGYPFATYWDLGSSGSVGLSLPSAAAGQQLELTLTVRQYVLSGIYTGGLTYNIDNNNGTQQGALSRTQVTSVDGFGGSWWDYTTDWQVSSSLSPDTVLVFGVSTGNLINEMQVTVVPETVAGVVCATGVVIAAALFHQRRCRATDKQSVSRS